MKSRGHEVLTAISGTDAISYAQRLLPDVIVMDLMMPGINGFAICAVLRNQPATKAIPVVMYTVLTGQIAPSSGFEAGADDYLTKPFKTQQLVTRVENSCTGTNPGTD